MSNFKKTWDLINKPTLFISWLALLVISMPIIIMPEESSKVISGINNWVLNYLGAPYLWFGLFCLGLCLYVIFSKYGKVHLGDEGEKPEFSMFAWAAMLFCCGVGAGVIYWGFVEWAMFYPAPPYGIEKSGWLAAEWSVAQSFFHWGPTAWAIYSVSACTFGYIMFVKKSNVLRCSEGCRPILGNLVDGFVGRLIDVFFIFGIVGAIATSLGLANPLVTACISTMFDLEPTAGLQITILLIIVGMFGVSSYTGLNKGIKFLSTAGVWVSLLLILYVFLTGDSSFIYNTTSSAIGLMGQNYLRMSTWLDTVGMSKFPQWWTVFYWAWWAGYAPFLGMFIARISRGRSVGHMVAGALVFGSLGCIIFFGVLGNYGLKLQITGSLDIVKSVADVGIPNTIVAIMQSLPMGNIVVGVVAVLCFIFAANSYDSASYIIAANTQKTVVNGESIPILRLIWAFGLSLVPIGFIMLDAPLATLQTATNILSIPIACVIVIVGLSYLKMVRTDILSGELKQKAARRAFIELIEEHEESAKVSA